MAAIDRERAEANLSLSGGGRAGYSEAYISNEFIQRLTLTKYTDVTMTASRHLSSAQRSMIKDSFKRQMITILPTPVIELLHLNIDKEDEHYTTGDLYENLVSGNPLGSLRTGSSITHARDLFDALWPIYMIVICLFVFNATDSLSLRRSGLTMISPVAFIALNAIFSRALVSDSVRAILDGSSRGYIVLIFDYTVIALAARVAITLIGASGGAGRVSTYGR